MNSTAWEWLFWLYRSFLQCINLEYSSFQFMMIILFACIFNKVYENLKPENEGGERRYVIGAK